MAEYNRGSGIRRHDFRGPKRRDAEQGREVRERYETDRDLAEDQYYDQGTMSSEAPKQQQGRSGAGTRNRPDAGRRDGYGMGRDRRERPRAPRQRGPPGSRTEEDRDGGAGYGLANTSPSHVHMRGQYGRRDRYEPDQRYSERKADIPERVANRVLGVERREMRRRQREEEEERLRKLQEEEEERRRQEAIKWEKYREYKAKMKEMIARGPDPSSRGFGAGRGKRIAETSDAPAEAIVEGVAQSRPRDDADADFEDEA